MKTLKDKVAAITGAGSGIGRATAMLMASKGCHLALSDVNEAGLAETAEAARGFSRFSQAGFVHIGQCQMAALAGHEHGGGTADTGAGAGNGGDLVFECLHDRFLSVKGGQAKQKKWPLSLR